MKPKITHYADGSTRIIEVLCGNEWRRPYPWPFPVSVGSDGKRYDNVCPKRVARPAVKTAWPYETPK